MLRPGFCLPRRAVTFPRRAYPGGEYSDHFAANGPEVFATAQKHGLEGIMSKRKKAPYRSGPSRNWLKTKNDDEEELAILGISRGAGKPTMALLGDEEDRH